MENDVVPIGKYKGKPIEVLMADEPYAQWMLAQSWFVERYADLANLLRIGRLSEPQDTPEHNAMIAGLIDQIDAAEWLIWKLSKRFEPSDVYGSNFRQEVEPKGGDLLISFDQLGKRIMIEAKPLIGDDYPTVIRQIKAGSMGNYRVVIAGKVQSSNLSFDQIRRQFELSGVHLIMFNDYLSAGISWKHEREGDIPGIIDGLESKIADWEMDLKLKGKIQEWEKGNIPSKISDAKEDIERLKNRS